VQKDLILGNLEAKRDWGFAPEYVDGMWRMLQLDNSEDLVLATGEAHSIKEFVDLAFKELDMELEWAGQGLDETGTDRQSGKTLVRVDPKYFRPTEVEMLIGDPSKAKELLNWEPKVKFKELVRIMVESDWAKVQKRGF
jgi:GDPmannose 4,6-dehydratase